MVIREISTNDASRTDRLGIRRRLNVLLLRRITINRGIRMITLKQFVTGCATCFAATVIIFTNALMAADSLPYGIRGSRIN